MGSDSDKKDLPQALGELGKVVQDKLGHDSEASKKVEDLLNTAYAKMENTNNESEKQSIAKNFVGKFESFVKEGNQQNILGKFESFTKDDKKEG